MIVVGISFQIMLHFLLNYVYFVNKSADIRPGYPAIRENRENHENKCPARKNQGIKKNGNIREKSGNFTMETKHI
jgi:hypothetical protein